MAGLLEKDLRLVLQRKQTLVIFLLLGLFMNYAASGEAAVAYLSFLCLILTVGTISYDEFDNGYAFLMTLPIDKKIYVFEKYVFCFLGSLLSWGVAVVIGIVMNSIRGISISYLECIQSWLILIPVLVLMEDFMIPVQLKYGAEKGRIVFALIACVIVGIGMLGGRILQNKQVSLTPLLERIENLSEVEGILIVLAVILLCTIISVSISKHVMDAKEY